jgi:guanine deaminase
MTPIRRIKTNILNPESSKKYSYQQNATIIFDKKIIEISNYHQENTLDYSDYICIPGFIDTHAHISQFNIRGKHSSNLLDWLTDYVFKEEYRSSEESYASTISRNFFLDAASKGTTCLSLYTAPYRQACETAFKIAMELGFRAFIGKTQMDVNCPDFLQEDTEQSMQESIDLFEKWNDHSDMLNYIFTPRFAPVCSSELMKEIGKFVQNNNAYLQTHLSENKKEIQWVRSLFPEFKNYTDVYQKHNLLGPKTLLGHCIHLDDSELKMIKDSDSKITHCPDSNFFLKSGVFPLERINQFKIQFALASDVGAGTSLSMMNVMRMFNYRHHNYVVSPQESLYHATLAGAEIMGISGKTGSIVEGKEADLVFLKIKDLKMKTENDILSDLLYMGEEIQVIETIIAGKTVYTHTS